MSYTFSKILSFKKEINQWLELFEACFGKRSNLNKEWYYCEITRTIKNK